MCICILHLFVMRRTCFKNWGLGLKKGRLVHDLNLLIAMHEFQGLASGPSI